VHIKYCTVIATSFTAQCKGILKA